VFDTSAFVGRYVVMSEAKRLVVALWVIHTHCVRAFEQTPYLAVTSPEKQCGKSRLLEALEMLVARPWMAVLPSEAVVYRTVHAKTPTLLLDEIDTIFNPRTADRYEGLRALLNAGHRRGARVPRCVGTKAEIVEFRTFCPKVLAGIGTLPETVADRSIPIRLERKTRGESVERFIRKRVEPGAVAIRDRIEAWADDNAGKLDGAEPAMPEQLSDRMQEGCEPLVAIADALGCGAEACAALVELLAAERLDDQESMRLRLLRDIRAIFDANPNRRAVYTASLLTHLYAIEEAPWATYYGRGLDARDLASLLHHYAIRSTTVRGPKDAAPAKGYRRDAFHAAWERYL
jgi:hypothetical protein